jgi:CubicO group peptidase (beta-lactamase class C family)
MRNPWDGSDPVRVVHLLEHATGWDDLALRDYALSDSTVTLRQGLDYTPRTRASRWRPGTRVAYCNSGPAVAAYIMEKQTGRPFEDLVRERLFEPIGMTTATYFPPAPPEALATLYHSDGVTPHDYWHISVRPAGAINASARDMARYVQFLLNRGRTSTGEQLIPAEAIVAMERPRSSLTARSGLTLGYGLHLGTYVDSAFVWVGHDGGVNGGLTIMAYRPDQGVGFTVMINAGNGEAIEKIDRLVRDYVTRDQPRPSPPQAVAMPQLARDRAGWYRFDNPRVQGLYFVERITGLVRVRAGDSTLTVRPLVGEGDNYIPVNERLFQKVGEPVPTLALVDDPANGRDQALERMGYLLPASYHRVAAPVAWLEVGVMLLFLAGTVVTLLFALVWVPRWVFRRLRDVPRLHLRAWPLLNAVSLIVLVGVFILSSEDLIPRFGNPTGWSYTLFGATLAFGLSALIGALVAWRRGAAEVKRGVRLYARVVCSVNAVVAAYLAWWGVIGWRTWV